MEATEEEAEDVTAHHCHAIGCGMVIPPRLLFCYRHWMMTPYVHRAAVRDAYRFGQEIDKNPSGRWMIAAQKAICAVAVREGNMSASEAQERVRHTTELFSNRLGPLNPPPPTRLIFGCTPHTEGVTWIGRGSPYGNPYSASASKHRVTLVANKAMAVTLYREWLCSDLELDGWVKPTRSQVKALKGKKLGCACKDLPCHGEVLADLADGGIWWLGAAMHPAGCVCMVCEQRVVDEIPF